MSRPTHNILQRYRVIGLHHISPILTLLIGVIMSFVAAMAVHEWQDERIRLAFDQETRDHIAALQRSLSEDINDIHSIGALYKASNKVDRDEFRAFAHEIIPYMHGFHSISWVPWIKHGERKTYLDIMQADYPGFTIASPNRAGPQTATRKQRPVYPVTFVEPFSGNENAMGIDLGSLPASLAVIKRARDTGKLTITSKITIQTDTYQQSGVLCVLPIYRNKLPSETLEQRRKNLHGFIVGLLDIDKLVQSSLLHLKDSRIGIQIHDMSPASSGDMMYSSLKSGARTNGRNSNNAGSLLQEVHMSALDREWIVRASGMRSNYGQDTSWEWKVVLLFGCSLSILLTAFLLNYLNRNRKIERQVQHRTRELTDSKQNLEREITARRHASAQLKEREHALRHQHELLSAISTAQSRFIRDTDVMSLFDKLLLDILSVTDSEYGFIGEILYRDNQPYLKTLAISNIAWDEESRKFYEEKAPSGLEFTNLDTLFGAAIKGKNTVIANEPASDSRSGGMPQGHPPLNAFLGVPFFRGDKVIGMYGIANRTQGYDQELVEFLAPITATCTQIVEALKTDRQRELTEEQLRERETRMRTIFENVVDGIITTNQRGIIESFNQAAEEMFGYTASEIVGKNVSILTPESHRARHDHYIEDYIEGRESRIMATGREVEGIRKDGTAFPIDIAITEMWIGEERYFCSIMRDITERKKVDRMKNEFVSTVSHELRTPLTSIRGALGLVGSGSAGELPEKARPLVDIATKNCDRLIRLINDILDIEKIEANKMEFSIRPAKLTPLMIQAVDSNQAYAAEHGAEILLTNDLSDAVVLIDEDRLMQVLTNLLSNAAKYSPQNGTIGISVQGSDTGVRISVSDQGPGIPEEFHNRLFDKFSQADGSDTRQKGGTGLGLSITRAIVEQMGGQISFTTLQGKGTTFHVDLPLHTASVTAVRSAARSSADTSNRILVCEDEIDIANLLRLLLEGEGYEIDIAHTAAEAKELLANHKYTAMTLDLMLPDQHGIELFRDIRASDKTRELPVIIVSAVADRQARKLSGDAVQVVDWIAKPVDEHRLMKAVAACVGKSAASRRRILHIEDETDMRTIVSKLLGDAHELHAASTLEQAKQRLTQERFDLVILDLSLPDGCGASLLPMLAEHSPPVPVVLFSVSEVDAETAGNVAAALVKSRTTDEKLIETINTTIARHPRMAKEA